MFHHINIKKATEIKKCCVNINNVGGGWVSSIFRLGIFLGLMRKLKKEKTNMYPAANGRYGMVLNWMTRTQTNNALLW